MSEMIADNQIFSQQSRLNISRHNNLKIDYLTDEKVKLQIEMNELKLNNSILRKVAQQLMKQRQFGLNELLQRNKELEDSYSELNNQNIKIKAQIFLAGQIKMDQQQEIKQIMRNYESKIIQLRRLVQIKQAYVQILQERDHGIQNDENPYLLNTSNLNYFNRLEEKCQQLEAMIKQNNILRKSNQSLKSHCTKMQQKLSKFESLMNCKTAYLQFKNIMQERQTKSLPKNQIKLRCNEQNQRKFAKVPFNKNNNESTMASLKLKQRNNISQLSMQFVRLGSRNLMVQKILDKKVTENKKLKQKIVKLELKLEQNNIQLNKLKQSNLLYQKKLKNLAADKNLYLQSIKNMYDYLLKRQISNAHKNKKVHQIQDNRNLIPMNNLMKKINKQSKKDDIPKINWKQVSLQVDITKVKPRQINKTVKRSLSCILDYVKVKQQKERANNQQINNNSFDRDMFISTQFSEMLEKKQNDLHMIIAAGGSKKCLKAYADNESNNFFQSNHIFESVLKNL